MKKILLTGLLFISIVGLSQDLTSNLKVCMPFNGNASDVSGSGNNGTVSGATLTTDRFGNNSSAYQFNGTSNFISIANFTNIAPTNELTISMWAKADGTSTNCLFMLSPDAPSDRCVGCAQYAGTMIWDYGDIGTGGRTMISITSDAVNWHHYVYIVSQSGNKKQMYMDGVLKSNDPYALTCNNKNHPFYIGAGNDGGTPIGNIRFHGKIDDICIYNRALNSNEVSALYNGTSVCFTVGMDELSNISSGMFYPTVSENGTYTYSGELNKLISVEIFTIDGKSIKSFSKLDISESQGKFNLNILSNGIYFVKLIKAEGTFTQKIIIEK